MDSNSADRITHVELTEFTVDQPCAFKSNEKENQTLQRIIQNDDDDHQQKNLPPQMKRSYHVETKTGKRGFLGLSPTGWKTLLLEWIVCWR